MSKKIAVINDLSGFGRCSLTAAIPVISVMGVQPCPLPTAVLTAQTGFPSYYCDDYTDKMPIFTAEWKKMNARFQGIYTGYVANPSQVDRILDFIELFLLEDTFLLVDPVMGDDGQTYGMFNQQLLSKMRLLVQRADITTPNLTELCLLTQKDFTVLNALKNPEELFAAITDMGRLLCQTGTKNVVVTGIHFQDPVSGKLQVGNLLITNKEHRLFHFEDLGGSYSGTGDLFASILAGSTARGSALSDGIRLAGSFLESAIAHTKKEQPDCREGVEFEPFLCRLLP